MGWWDKDPEDRRYLPNPMKEKPEDMSIWTKTTVEEEDNKIYPIRETGEWLAQGYQSQRWLGLKPSMQPGDELYRFCTSHESWEHLAGRAGIALVVMARSSTRSSRR
jgi:hypothetical protein